MAARIAWALLVVAAFGVGACVAVTGVDDLVVDPAFHDAPTDAGDAGDAADAPAE